MRKKTVTTYDFLKLKAQQKSHQRKLFFKSLNIQNNTTDYLKHFSIKFNDNLICTSSCLLVAACWVAFTPFHLSYFHMADIPAGRSHEGKGTDKRKDYA